MIRVRLTDDIIYKHRGFVCEYLSARMRENEWITKLTPAVIKFINRKMNSIVCGLPHLLLETHSDLNSNFNLDKITYNGETIRKYLREFFSYDDFSRGTNVFRQWDAYELSNALGINTCPYCNREYINTVINQGTHVIRPAFDHYYCRNIYPILGLSIYNLIPSCEYCNSSLKGQKDFGIANYIHPLIEGFDDDGVFTYIPKNGGGLYNQTIENSDIFIDSSLAPSEKQGKINNSTSVFEINTIYTHCHMDLLNGIVSKCRSVEENLNFYATLGMNSVEELYYYIFSNYYNRDDYLKCTFSKFTRDIVSESGLIEKLIEVIR